MDAMSTLKAPPLTEPQRKRLVCLIARESVIHNKSQHNANLARKKRAWHDIAITFNAAYPSREHRTPRQLKRSWEHIKRKVRQEHSEYNRKKLKLPEGGPPPSPPKLSEAMVAAVPLMGRDLAHDSIDIQLDDDDEESDPLSHTIVGEESLPSTTPKTSQVVTMAAIAQMGRDLALESLGLQAGVEGKDQELQTKTEIVDELQAGTSISPSSPPALTSYNIAPPSSQTFSSASSLLQTILSSPSSQHSNSTSLPPISSTVSETHFPSLFFPPTSSAVTITSPSSVIPSTLLPTNSTSFPHLILLSSLSQGAPSLASDKTIIPTCTPPTCTTPTSPTLVSSPPGPTRFTGCRKTTDELFNQVRQRQDESHNKRMQQIQEEHETLMQQRKEEHEARMKHMEEEMRWKEEEHKAKMQLMQSSKNSIQEAFAPLIDFLNTGKLAYASMATAYKKIAESVLSGNEDT